MSKSRLEYIKDLKQDFFKGVEEATPAEIKKAPFFDLKNPNPFEFVLTKDIVEKFQLERWLLEYEKEAKVSTGGIRGPQNVLYYWDTRFPINQMGVALATLGKALVLKEQIKEREINKIVSGEVRYNTAEYVELISRIAAAQGINVHMPYGRKPTTVWLTSLLIFMLDYDGGEYVTSSHAVSSKTATKDLENQGSQFLPEMSLAFVEKIRQILQYAKTHKSGYVIKVSARNDSRIKEDFDGYDMYVDYLKKGIANKTNLDLIKSAEKKGLKIIFDTVGGCMGANMPPILKSFGIDKVYQWRNKEEDPFFHGVGKTRRKSIKTGKIEYFDLSCDSTLPEVVKTMGYAEDLKDCDIGQLVLMTDPDGDRLVIGQIEPSAKAKLLDDLGIYYERIVDEKIFSVYHPTYSFLMTMDFHARQLKAAGIWENHSRFMINTAPSSRSWDEWAKAQGIKVITTPVGFKEIATVMKKVEKKIIADSNRNVVLTNIFGNEINLGKDPRLVFAGEESGGMITGPEELLISKGGRKALAMREKSAGEAAIITTALAADLFLNKKSLSDYLLEIFEKNAISSRYYFRDDIIYYNESEPDPEKIRQEKKAGELLRDKTDMFYLGLALSLKEKIITIKQVQEILGRTFCNLDFSDLENIYFVGESSHLKFKTIFVQIRRSGTDAKMRGYSGGSDKDRAKDYLQILLHYDGNLPDVYRKYIPEEFSQRIYDKVEKNYKEYLYKDL
ncbi:hypothetical protein C4569_02145 [Candidatus Parcubacteria bacterium]|nr:MAG: hypothetical protein C4569_02145 [Candidatus Parcubacteria bacterium]